jgi:hypothetical protein
MNAEDALPLSRVTCQLIQERCVVRQRHTPGGAPREFGAAPLEWILVSDTVGLMRLPIAEMRRFPDPGEQHQPHGRTIRALLGEKLNVPRAEIEAHIARGVAFFLAGCGLGGVH